MIGFANIIMENIQYQPVDLSNWTDLEQLFESRGGPHNCWCMIWRYIEEKDKQSNKVAKKRALHSYIEKGTPIGLQCYMDQEPIAWCSIAPRETYRELHGDQALENVWSLVCFFIKRKYRKQGLNRSLIEEAMKYAKEQGARYIEAYPVDVDSPSYRFMGNKPLFEEMGFTFIHRIGKRRYAMIKAL